MSIGKVLTGILAGVAVGTTIGILYAPDKGTATRKKISQKSNKYVEDLSQKFNDFVDSINKKIETVSDEVSRMAHNGKAKVEEVEKELTSTANSFKTR